MCNSLFKYESTNGILTFCKNLVFEKNLILVLWSKNLQTNQNTGFFNLQYLTNGWGMKWNFCMQLYINKATNLLCHFK